LSTQSVLERCHPGRRAALKREILARSLACFNDQGIEATTIEVIKAACETSVGAVYHHFGNKDGLVAALFFCALDDQAQLTNSRLSDATDQRSGVHAVVFSYLDWVTAEPELARFLFQAGPFVAKGPHAQMLVERNRSRNQAILARFSAFEENAALSRCPPELLASLIVGQSEHYCRAWLAGRVRATPQAHRHAFAEAAWGSVTAVAALAG
jgi:AcrR family transcriptional regulator